MSPISIATTLPERWNEIRFRYVAATFKGRLPAKGGRDAADADSLPYLSMEYLRGDSDASIYVSSEGMVAAENQDVLLLWDGSNAGEFLRAKYGAVSSTAALVSPFKFDRKFLFWLCKAAEPVLKTFTNGMGIPHVDGDILRNLVLPYPLDAEDRERIANYLDRETARIDGLITEKERMLALLEEKRAALISRVVTRGLDPNMPLKSSGEKWLGEVPEHWRVVRAKAFFREVDIRSVMGEETLLSLRLGKGLVPHHDVSDKPLEASDVVGFKKVEVGQMVINRMRAASGLIAVAQQPGLVSPDYAVFDVLNRDLCIEYFLELFKTPLLQAVFRSSSKGLGTGEQGFLRLYTDAFLALHFPYPPENEQQAIAEFIQRERCEFQATEALLRRSIELARERRSALISAAVTGQIPTEEMAA